MHVSEHAVGGSDNGGSAGINGNGESNIKSAGDGDGGGGSPDGVVVGNRVVNPTRLRRLSHCPGDIMFDRYGFEWEIGGLSVIERSKIETEERGYVVMRVHLPASYILLVGRSG